MSTTPDEVQPTENEMLAAAMAYDNADGESADPSTAPAPVTPEPGKGGESAERPAAPETKTGTETAKPAEPAAGEKPDPAKPTDGATAPDGKPEGTKFQTAKKDAERRDTSWKALNAEKDALAREKAAIEEEKRRVAAEREQLSRTKAAPADPLAKFSDQEIEAFAKKSEEDGDIEMAKVAKAALAERAAGRRAKETQEETTKAQQAEFSRTWDHYRAEALKAFPELGDPESDLFKAATGYLNHKSWGPFLRSNPLGAYAAAEVAKLSRTAASVPVLEKTVAEQKTEIERLTKLLSIDPSPKGGNGATPTKKVGEETEGDVLAACRAYDEGEDVST